MASAGFELSVQQRALLGSPTSGGHAARCTIEISGPVAAEDLRAALAAVVQRHEILRTHFAVPEGMKLPVQIVVKDATFGWGESPESSADVAARGVDSQDAGLRAELSTAGEKSYLTLIAPAAIADAQTLTAAGLEAIALCAGGPTGSAGPEPLQYADFATWQQEMLAAADAAALAAESHWRNEGAGEPVSFEPGDVAASEISVAEGVRDAVERTAGSMGVDAADVWAAATAALLSRLTGRPDVILATTVDGRQDAELSGAMGPYAIGVPVRFSDVTSSPVGDLARRASIGRVAGTEHALRPSASAVTAAAASFSYDRLPNRQQLGALDVRVVDRIDAPSPTMMRISVIDDGTAARILVIGSGSGVGAIGRHLPPLLEALVADDAETTNAGRLPLWSAAARAAELATGTTVPAAAAHVAVTFHALVEAAAQRDPGHPAVVAGDATLSYADLEARANRLAHALRGMGATRNQPVAILLDRRADLVVALLGVLKSGAPYLPLHADHPADRLAFQVSDSGARVVVTVSSLAQHVPAGCEVLILDSAVLDGQPDSTPEGVNDSGDLAYVIYTSGSTGEPKGVGVTHANLVAYTAAVRERLLGDDPDGLDAAIVTSISTDLGNTSIVLALAGGGALHVIPADVAVDATAYAQWTAEHPVDVLKITPSHLRALLVGGAGVLPRKLLIVGGEALPWELVREVETLGQCAVANHYGPTETTVGALAYPIAKGERRDDSATVPIGQPLPGYRCYVLDAHGEPVPSGVTGELCIGGVGVARGYVGRDDLTAERFVADPLGGRMYRTGDLVRRLRDGAVEFLGRVDGQVKIRGYRVEPGEVEAILEAHAMVRQAAVVPQPDPSGDLRLIAYVVGEVSAVADVDALRSHVSARLPAHMVPSVIVPIPSMPLTANGKLDRKALPDPASVRLSDESSYVAPRDDVEATIAGVWAELLGVPQVGVDDDFFGLGGHSLLAAQVIARILRDFGVQLPLHSLFVAPTVAALAAMVRSELAGGQENLESLLGDLENMTDEEAERLLAGGAGSAEGT